MDIFLPEKTIPQDRLVVLIVHGGAWKHEIKSTWFTFKRCFKNNIPSVNMNYRYFLKELRTKNNFRILIPAILKFNSLAEKAELLPNNFIILGESGGHLAFYFIYQNPIKIKKIISCLAPPIFILKNICRLFYSRYTSRTIQKWWAKNLRGKIFLKHSKSKPHCECFKRSYSFISRKQRFSLVNHKQGLALDSVLTKMEIPHKLVYMKIPVMRQDFSIKKRETRLFILVFLGVD